MRTAFRLLALQLLVAALLFTGCTSVPHVVDTSPRCVQLVGTNDLHGHLEATSHGPGTPSAGGVAALGGYLDILRHRYPGHVLFLDAGDLFQGTLLANLTRGRAVIAAYNSLGVAATAIGNHEFDYGREGNPHDLQGALEARMRQARFPMLACNLRLKSGARPTWAGFGASTMVTLGGLKVGVIGAITADAAHTTAAANVADLKFENPAPCVAEEARKLRAQGAQLTVLVAHLGGRCTDTNAPESLQSCDPQGEVFELLGALPPHTLDAVVAGHTHGFIAQHVGGTAVIESGAYGKAFGWAQLCVDRQGRTSSTVHPPVDLCLSTWANGTCGKPSVPGPLEPARFLGRNVQPDASVERALAPYVAKVKGEREGLLGVSLPAPLVGDRHARSPLGHLVAQAMRGSVPGAQVAMVNAGGLRASLPAGPLRCGDVFEVMPFEDRLVKLTLSGAQLRAFVLAPLRGGYGHPQLAGAKLTGSEPTLVLDDGTPVNDAASYVLVTNNFLADGGDGTEPVVKSLAPSQRVDQPGYVRDAVIALLRRTYPAAGAESAVCGASDRPAL